MRVAQALGTATKMSFVTGSELVIDNYNSFGQNVGMYNYTGSLLTNFGGNGTIDLKDFSPSSIGRIPVLVEGAFNSPAICVAVC